MAVTYWEGTVSGDWMNNANWSGVLPVADDEVIFDARCTDSETEPTEGMLDSESGATANSTFDLLHFKVGYNQGLATSAEPCCCSPDKIIIEGTGTYHILVGKTNQSTNTTVPIVIVNNPDAIVYLYSNCNDGANLAEFTDVYVIAGTVYEAYYDADTDNTGCSVANLYLVPLDGKASNVTVYIEKDAYDALNASPNNIYMANGVLTTDSQIGILHLIDGTVNYGTDLAGSPESDLDITTLIQQDGVINWLPDDSGTPTITTAWIFGGAFDASGSTNDDRAKTIVTLHMFEGATVDLANNKANITVTNLYRHGGVLIADSASKLAITYNQP